MSFGHQGVRTTKQPAVAGRLLFMVELRGIDNPLPPVAS